jgi:hypothetical protein
MLPVRVPVEADPMPYQIVSGAGLYSLGRSGFSCVRTCVPRRANSELFWTYGVFVPIDVQYYLAAVSRVP